MLRHEQVDVSSFPRITKAPVSDFGNSVDGASCVIRPTLETFLWNITQSFAKKGSLDMRCLTQVPCSAEI